MLSPVNWLKPILAMGVLALWLPASNHCRLEQLPGLGFLSCCEHELASEAAGHHEDDCNDDWCAVVEQGLYKTDNQRIVANAPTAVAALFLLSCPDRVRELISALPPRRADVAPELSKIWQFSFRAAAPPRAPSVAS
jgi:hypothetical protein